MAPPPTNHRRIRMPQMQPPHGGWYINHLPLPCIPTSPSPNGLNSNLGRPRRETLVTRGRGGPGTQKSSFSTTSTSSSAGETDDHPISYTSFNFSRRISPIPISYIHLISLPQYSFHYYYISYPSSLSLSLRKHVHSRRHVLVNLGAT